MKAYIAIPLAIMLIVTGLFVLNETSDEADASITENATRLTGTFPIQYGSDNGYINAVADDDTSVQLFKYSVTWESSIWYVQFNDDFNTRFQYSGSGGSINWEWSVSYGVGQVRIWHNDTGSPLILTVSGGSSLSDGVKAINGYSRYGEFTVTNADYPWITTTAVAQTQAQPSYDYYVTDWNCIYVAYTLTFTSVNAYGSVSESFIEVPQGSVIWSIPYSGPNQMVLSAVYVQKPDNSVVTIYANAEDNTAQYSYYFNGWSNNVTDTSTAIIADMAITADFVRITNQYTLTIQLNQNWGTVSNMVLEADYGTIPSVSGTALTLGSVTSVAVPYVDTAEYTYDFVEWEDVPDVLTESSTVTAVFSRVLNEYTVTFATNDSSLGTVNTQSLSIPYGTVPVAGTGNTLIVGEYEVQAIPHEDTSSTHYWLSQWQNLVQVTNDMTITAVFDSGVRAYDVSFLSSNQYGNVDHVSLNVDYGTQISVNGNKVTVGSTEVTAVPIPSTQQYVYYFVEWNGVTATVEGDMTITADFDVMLHPYTITLTVDKPAYGQWSESMITVPYGTSVVKVRNTITFGSTTVTVNLAPNTSLSTYKVIDMNNVPNMVTGDTVITANLGRDNGMDAFNIIQPEQSQDDVTRQKEGPAWSLVLVLPIFVIVSLIIYAVKFGRHDDYNDF